jgi:O-antigen ligase
MHSEKYRNYAINAFLIGCIVTLTISYLKLLHVVPYVDNGNGYVVFKNRITQNIFTAFAVYLMSLKASNTKGSHRVVWIILGVLGVVNVLFMVNGRSGQIILFALEAFFVFQTWGLKSIKYMIVSIVLCSSLLHFTNLFSNSRLFGTVEEMKDSSSSAGLRAGYYKNSLKLIKDHLILGVGTGSFEKSYNEKIKGDPTSFPTSNPHNQFLLTYIEIGCVGFLAFIYMLFSQWKQSIQIASLSHSLMLRGLLICFVLGSLTNSLLMDAGEGRFYGVMMGVLLSGLPLRKTEF